MSKKSKKAISINQEIAEAAEAIASIKGEDIAALTEQFLQNYVMENMSVLINKLNHQSAKSEPVNDNARSEN